MNRRPTPVYSSLVAGTRNMGDVAPGLERTNRYRPRTQPGETERNTYFNQNVENCPGSQSTNSTPESPDYDHQRLRGDHYQRRCNSVGFWDYKMKHVRRQVFVQWIRTTFILFIFIFSVLCLCWGVLSGANSRVNNLAVHVVDFDGQVPPYNNVTPIVGPTMTNLTQRILLETDATSSLGYDVIPARQYGYDPLAVRHAVYERDCWAAVIINSNATALLLAAAQQGNSSYDPSGAIQYVVQTARQEMTNYGYIQPRLRELTSLFLDDFGVAWTKMLLSNNSFNPNVMALAPQVVNPGVMPVEVDLRPFRPGVAAPAVSIALIYLIIVAFFSFSFFMPIHIKFIQTHNHPALHYWQLIIWRWSATMVSYVFISLAYSLVSLAFGIHFSRQPASDVDVATNATAYGRASFPIYWGVNFAGMAALGLACENAAMIMGQPWTALWLLFWVISNVATSFYSLELAPSFFAFGRAWPLYHVVQASRQIIFDLKSDMTLNIGVLAAWIAADTALFPLCCYLMRWRMEHGLREADRTKDCFIVATVEGSMEVPKREGDKQPKFKRGFMRGM
ncbi:MNNG and nitrosoguanidine resistance protein [Xylariaceae sp. FL0255]|nr:MNNG and nitrosoguanidine resistance protein [Xylariaceae sp. FL0255]